MNTSTKYPSIKSVEFINNSLLFVRLDNDRTFIVPLEKFPVLQQLSVAEKKDFEIIDEKYLSFLSIDEIFSLEDLIGLPWQKH